MKDKILKIAGVKSEADFYKQFPTEASFKAKFGKELKKAQGGITYPSFQQSVSNTAPGMCPPNHQKNLLTGLCEPIFNYGTNGSPQIQSNLGQGFVRNPETNMYSKHQQFGST
jgi:hypothetical protein